MRAHRIDSIRRGRVLVAGAFIAALTACSSALQLDVARSETTAPPRDTILAAEQPESTTVEVRAFPYSPTVSVVGWSVEDAGYGLQASLRRDGSIVRDHRFFVSTYYTPWVRTIRLAAMSPIGLEMLGISRDSYACYFGKCSPPQSLGVRIPDEMLRANRDSAAVTFYGRDGRVMVLPIRRELIDAYLAKVDSVSSALRKRG
jgi:hypothetical protein